MIKAKGNIVWGAEDKFYVSVKCEKGMAPHSSVLAWRIPWTEEPDALQSLGSQRVGQD